ncbi:hypothetical protein ABK040_010250 [Willaertia magna]
MKLKICELQLLSLSPKSPTSSISSSRNSTVDRKKETSIKLETVPSLHDLKYNNEEILNNNNSNESLYGSGDSSNGSGRVSPRRRKQRSLSLHQFKKMSFDNNENNNSSNNNNSEL